MTVRDLIKKLQGYSEELPICTVDDNTGDYAEVSITVLNKAIYRNESGQEINTIKPFILIT